MSKRMPRKEDKRNRVRAGKQRGLAPISLVLSLVVTGVALANWGGSRTTTEGSKEKKSGEMAIAGFTANSPSKEYIYGGRLLATEECSYSISPTSSFYAQGGGSGSVNVTAPTGCTWTVVNVPTWITLTSADGGSGNDVVTFEVRENFTGSAQQATFTIAGLDFTVVQDAGLGSDCGYSISPTSQSFSASGGTGTINVTSEERCAWQAVSNVSWVTVTSGSVGVGNGIVSYSVAANTTGSSRDGTITIAGLSFNVKQKKP